MTYFKYRTPASALRCLAEGSLYFASPEQLNDTLEAKYDQAPPKSFMRVMEQTMSQISQQRGGPKLAFDPVAITEITSAINKENERLAEFTNKIGIFSASKCANNQAMWAYYAADASGVCFELELNQETAREYRLFATEVTYHDKHRIHNRAEDWQKAFKELARENPRASIEELQELSCTETEKRKWGVLTASRAASVKHTDWKHEKEIRLFAPTSGALPILKDMLKRVHFVRFDSEYSPAIIQTLNKNYPSVEIVQWQFSHGALSARPTPMEIKLVPIKG